MAKIMISQRRRAPRKGRAALLAATALAASVILNVTAYAPPALANPACGHDDPIAPSKSGPGTYNFTSWIWKRSDNDVEGVRAPILVRTDGELCTNAHLNGFVSAWIGIQSQKDNQLAQIGYDRHWNADGNPEHCRFWANGIGITTYYDCTDADATYVFFLVEVHKGADGRLFYEIEDCGTGGDFSNCTVKNATQGAFTYPEAAVASEANFGDPASGCPEQMLGDNFNPVLYGNSNWGLRGEVAGNWGPQTWDMSAPVTCTGDYKGATTSSGLETWDSRNTT